MTQAPAEPGPQVPAPVAEPAAAMSRVLVLRAVLALVLAIGAGLLAVLLYRHGVQLWPFGPAETATEVPRYIGPWMVAAAAALLAAGLLLGSAGSDAHRLVVSRRTAHLPGTAT